MNTKERLEKLTEGLLDILKLKKVKTLHNDWELWDSNEFETEIRYLPNGNYEVGYFIFKK